MEPSAVRCRASLPLRALHRFRRLLSSSGSPYVRSATSSVHRVHLCTTPAARSTSNVAAAARGRMRTSRQELPGSLRTFESGCKDELQAQAPLLTNWSEKGAAQVRYAEGADFELLSRLSHCSIEAATSAVRSGRLALPAVRSTSRASLSTVANSRAAELVRNRCETGTYFIRFDRCL